MKGWGEVGWGVEAGRVQAAGTGGALAAAAAAPWAISQDSAGHKPQRQSCTAVVLRECTHY